MEQECARLQQVMKQYFHRNRSVLDTISKLECTVAKTHRAVIKSATHCGCMELWAKIQPPAQGEAKEMLSGALCPICREKVEQSLSDTVFYLMALSDVLNLDFTALLRKQRRELELLGKFTLK